MFLSIKNFGQDFFCFPHFLSKKFNALDKLREFDLFFPTILEFGHDQALL